MRVRPASTDDRFAILDLIRANPTLPQWTAADLATGRMDAHPNALTRALLVVGEEGGIDGFAQASAVLGEAELEGMAVAEAHRGNGIGRALLDACLRWAEQQEATIFRLEVRQGNAAAIHLYRTAGLEAVGVRQNYYRDPMDDAVLMERNL